jgi:hypothetical protein
MHLNTKDNTHPVEEEECAPLNKQHNKADLKEIQVSL